VRAFSKTAICLAVNLCATIAAADDWPAWRGPQGDGVWREQGIVAELPADSIAARWRVPVASGYSGPTVADGRVYVMDRVTKPAQTEGIHCFAWDTGQALWSHTYGREYRNVGYGAGPRASVVIDSGRAYALGAMGDLHCLDAATGQVRWRRPLNEEYGIDMPIWGIAASPVVVGDLLIVQVGGAGACLVAFDKVSGQERWRALDDRASYSTPVLVEHDTRQVLVCWTGDGVVGLDAASGQALWTHPLAPQRMVLAVASPVVDAQRLFLTGFYDGSLMLRLLPGPAVEEAWRRVGPSEKQTDGLHSIISTPVLLDDHIYGFDSYGEFRCLRADTGERVWESLDLVPRARWATGHLTPNGDRVWIFTERGDLLLTSLSPEGPVVHGRAHLIDATRDQLNQRGGVVWSHPAYAYRHIFVRNDEELVCASLAAD
jgi:outer membrane protein assembly factor BamB